MAATVIGVPLMGTSFARKYMQGKYTQCLCRAGATVKILEPVPKADAIKRYLDECDGFLFPGGADIAPGLYGQQPQPGCGKPNPVRDGFEVPLIHAVLEAEKPLLCICRGMQLLNISLGGTLIQDIKPVQKYNHADFFHKSRFTHPVELKKGSMVAGIFEDTSIKVNSLHHQVVERLGDGLYATAKSPEGFVEAIEFQSRSSFALGVQWHPEHMAAKDPSQQLIFERFVSSTSAGYNP